MTQGATVARDGMAIDWDVPIEMDDGLTLRGGSMTLQLVAKRGTIATQAEPAAGVPALV